MCERIVRHDPFSLNSFSIPERIASYSIHAPLRHCSTNTIFQCKQYLSRTEAAFQGNGRTPTRETITAQRRVAATPKHSAGALPYPMHKLGERARVWRNVTLKYECLYLIHSNNNRKTVCTYRRQNCPFFASVVLPWKAEAPPSEITSPAGTSFVSPPQGT